MSVATSIVEQIFRRARIEPTAVALISGAERVTYRELAQRAGALAGALEGAPTPVAVLAHKVPDAIALVLGLMYLRRPVLLLAPNLPEERALHAATVAGAGCIVDPRTGEASPIPAPPGGRPPVPAPTAPVMFTTSGSTGTPKVVPLSAGALRRFAAWAQGECRMGPGTGVLSLAPLNFDLSLLEVWAALGAGCRVLLVGPALAPHGRRVRALVREHDIRVVQAVPTLARLLAAEEVRAPGSDPVGHAEEAQESVETVHTVILTGDRSEGSLVRRLQGVFPEARILNVYGMTETNDSFLYRATGEEPEDQPLPIGDPLPGVLARVLRPDGAVSAGGEGELLVHTPFQTAGYLPAVDEDARFLDLPAAGGGTVRMLRTGDRVRIDPGAPARLLGRADRLVKTRGILVDLTGIERICERFPGVLAAAAVAEPHPLEGNRIAVVVQRAPEINLDLPELRRLMTQAFPAGGAPAELHVAEAELALTSTGKIDRIRALTEARNGNERK